MLVVMNGTKMLGAMHISYEVTISSWESPWIANGYRFPRRGGPSGFISRDAFAPQIPGIEGCRESPKGLHSVWRARKRARVSDLASSCILECSARTLSIAVVLRSKARQGCRHVCGEPRADSCHAKSEISSSCPCAAPLLA